MEQNTNSQIYYDYYWCYLVLFGVMMVIIIIIIVMIIMHKVITTSIIIVIVIVIVISIIISITDTIVVFSVTINIIIVIVIIAVTAVFIMAKIIDREAEMGHHLSREFGQWIVAKWTNCMGRTLLRGYEFPGYLNTNLMSSSEIFMQVGSIIKRYVCVQLHIYIVVEAANIHPLSQPHIHLKAKIDRRKNIYWHLSTKSSFSWLA